MKKYLILTSILALAACGGGSGGGHGGAVIPPNDNIGNEIIDNGNHENNNDNVIESNRVSTTLPAQVDNKANIVAYVESKLGSDYYDVAGTNTPRYASTRESTTRNNQKTLTLDEKYIQARAKLDSMNDILSKMLEHNNTSEFVSQHTHQVEEALKLFGSEINFGETIDKIVEVCKDVTSHRLDEIKNRYEYKRETLGDIEFKAIETDSAVMYDYVLKFTVNDDNEIVAINHSTTSFSEPEVVHYLYSDDKKRFIDQDPEINEDISYFRSRDIIDLKTFGKNAGLSYSDFGYYVIENHYEQGDNIYEDTFNNVFAGGYSAKKVEKPHESVKYTGTAIAAVDSWLGGENTRSQLSITDDANLIIKDGNETLTANFSKSEKPWYDVVIHNGEVSFNNGDNLPEWLTITDDMKNKPYLEQKVEHTYFGDGDASEVISTLQYKNYTGNSPNEEDFRRIEVGMAFGGKKE